MKMEWNFQRNNTQAAWQQIQTMVGYKVRSKKLDLDEKAVNDLGDFYSRFDTQDFSVLNESVRESMFSTLAEVNSAPDSTISMNVKEQDVRNVFASTQSNRSSWCIEQGS